MDAGIDSQISKFSTQEESNSIPEYEIKGDTNFAARTTEGSRAKWSLAEDEILLHCVMITTKDSLRATNRTSDTYWGTITTMYNEKRMHYPLRSMQSIRNHFNRTQQSINKFIVVHNKVTQMKVSGQTEDDVLREAYKLYEASNNGKKFMYEHMWRILQTNGGPKWRTNMPKRTKLDVSGTYSSSSPNPSEGYSVGSMTCPIGRDAAKCKGKGVASQSIVEGEDNDIYTTINSFTSLNDESNANIREMLRLKEIDIEEKRRFRELKEAKRKDKQERKKMELELQFCMFDTSKMNEQQRQVYERLYKRLFDE